MISGITWTKCPLHAIKVFLPRLLILAMIYKIRNLFFSFNKNQYQSSEYHFRFKLFELMALMLAKNPEK